MVFTLVMLASSAPSAWAATSEADALAMTGQEYLAKGRVEKAKDCFFKALFHDEDCPIALYELSKIFQQEQNTAAASDFYTRSIHQMENRLSSHPDYESKISDAKTRLQAVNPYAGQFSIAMEDYAQDLGKIVKKSNDTLTNEEVSNRVTVLCLASIVPANKMPELEKSAPAQTKKIPAHATETQVASSGPVPLDIERALKAAGWTTITGQWKKKSEGVYEVTNGKLETTKVNGAMQFILYPGSTGTVSALVRNGNHDPHMGYVSKTGNTMGYQNFTFCSGYGISITDRDCKVFTPQGGFTGNEFYPGLDHTTNLQPVKHQIMISIAEKENNKGSALAIQVDGKKENNSSYKLNKDGPFTIEIKGTATIEDPKALGQ
jgi:hypothetical protein